MLKHLRERVVLWIGNLSTASSCTWQHRSAIVDKCQGKNKVFWDCVGCSVLERCVHEVIGVERVPIYAIIEICHSKDLLIGTASDLH